MWIVFYVAMRLKETKIRTKCEFQALRPKPCDPTRPSTGHPRGVDGLIHYERLRSSDRSCRSSLMNMLSAVTMCPSGQ